MEIMIKEVKKGIMLIFFKMENIYKEIDIILKMENYKLVSILNEMKKFVRGDKK